MTKNEIDALMKEAGVIGMKLRSDGFYVVEKEVFYRFAELLTEKVTEETNKRANESWTYMCKRMIEAERERIAAHFDARPQVQHIGANVATWVRARNATVS